MVFKGSRYTNTDVITPPRYDGTAPRVLAEREFPVTTGVLTHIVVDGERLDQLAAQFYSDATKYWQILDANLGVLNPFELLVPGGAIQIPQNRLVRS